MRSPFPSLVRPGRVAVVLVLAAAVAGGLWLWGRAGSSTEVSGEDAVRDFRARSAGAAETQPGGPRPGVYTFAVRGSERGDIGPIGVDRELPRTARYVVTRVPGGFEESLQLSEEHVEATRFRAAPDGLRATWRRTDVTFVGVGRDDRRRLDPPPLHMPAGLRVGQEWTARYRAGSVSVVARSRVLREEVVRVGGRPVRTLVVRTDSDTAGPHPGTRTETRWWSPAMAMPVRWTIDMRITGIVGFSSRALMDLRSADPRT